MKTAGSEFQGSAQPVSEGIEVFTLTSPESVRGICCRRTADGLTLTRGELTCKSTRITLSDSSAAALVFSALADLRSVCSSDEGEKPSAETEKTSDGYTVRGQTRLCKYTAYADNSGTIRSLECGAVFNE